MRNLLNYLDNEKFYVLELAAVLLRVVNALNGV